MSDLPRAAGTLLRIAVLVTALHLISSGLGLLDAATALTISVSINVVLFLVGAVVFTVAFVLAAGRSRDEELWFGGVFFLTGEVVAASHRRLLFICLGVQVVVGLTVAALRPFTAAAFAVLVPLLGLGLIALYGARYGRFPARTVQS
jgi:hypothetical protein